MRTKYITFNNAYGEPDIIVFSEMMQHAAVARALQIHRNGDCEPGGDRNTIIGAGFIHNVGGEGLECFGTSVSLKVPSHVADSKIANDNLPTLRS